MGSTLTVYHYTDEDRLDQILRSGYIRESQLRRADAFFGSGVYLTTMGPSSGRKRISENNWGDLGSNMEEMGRTDRAIKLHIPRDNLAKAKSGGRDIWVHTGDVDLSHYTYSVEDLTKGGPWCNIL